MILNTLKWQYQIYDKDHMVPLWLSSIKHSPLTSTFYVWNFDLINMEIPFFSKFSFTSYELWLRTDFRFNFITSKFTFKISDFEKTLLQIIISNFYKLTLDRITLCYSTCKSCNSIRTLKFYTNTLPSHLIWTSDLNSLIKGLVKYDFIFETHMNLITKLINEPKLDLFYLLSPIIHKKNALIQLILLGLVRLLNKS